MRIDTFQEDLALNLFEKLSKEQRAITVFLLCIGRGFVGFVCLNCIHWCFFFFSLSPEWPHVSVQQENTTREKMLSWKLFFTSNYSNHNLYRINFCQFSHLAQITLSALNTTNIAMSTNTCCDYTKYQIHIMIILIFLEISQILQQS